MKLFGICATIFLVLVAPTSLAYPSSTRSQSPALANNVSPGALLQVNLTNLAGYPVYPTECFRRTRPIPPPSRFTNLITDCLEIINNFLLRQDGSLFQDLLFSHTTFQDQLGQRHLSRWQHRQCVIMVASTQTSEKQTLQLFNVVLAANKILKECIQEEQIARGGTTSIGSPNSSFYVDVLGMIYGDIAHKSNISPTTSNTESSIGAYNVNDSTDPLPPSLSMEKRDPDPHHGPSLSTVTQTLVPGGVLGMSSLDMPSMNVSGRVKAPPSYPVECFNPYSVKLNPAARQDCEFVINQIILRYPNPMHPQTFGYRPSAGIDLSLPQNEKWAFGHCAIFVRNLDKTRTDTFRIVDVAYTAHRIMTDCVTGKYPVGGTAHIGTVADSFYVGLGGPPQG